ncbi:restriction endonuclease subunit S [Clostridium butyricum]|uniref:Restriction endonuclease subunit S n=1 Tax=Clostridium butyricum TaxID=1492 RepID=A0A6L9ESM7_CLOBU|nr:restriction endonuclease subunit S [Clostridium butyricum]
MTRKMKDSGVEWIGEIPEEWSINKTKHYFSYKKVIVGNEVDNYDRLALTLNGVIKRGKDDSEGLQPEKFEGYQILNKNELVFKLIDLENIKTSRVGLSKFDGIVSPAYIILTNKSENNKIFYYYFMSMYYRNIFNKLGGDGVRSSLGNKDLLNIPIVAIDEDEQIKIANYLDNKVANIDQTIEKEKQVIEKLKEYKQSVITEAVTKGLNPNVPMKDSGVEWIGEIPEEWLLPNLSKCADIGSGGTPNRNILEYWNNGEIPWMSSGEVNNEYIVDTKEKITQYAIDNSNAKLLPQNTIMLGLIGQGKTKGKVAILDIECACNQNLAYLICNSKILNYKYLFYCFKSMYNYLRGLVGESQAGIYLPLVKALKIPLPKIEEQSRIICYLDKKCSTIDKLISNKEKVIEKLTEYKKSLIYECVTGKREVQ